MGARENTCQISQELWKHRYNSENFICKVHFVKITDNLLHLIALEKCKKECHIV